MADPNKGSVDRRKFLKGAAAAGVVAVTPSGAVHAQDHQDEHDNQVVPSDPALRTKALESLLVEKEIVDPKALDALVDAYEHKIGPKNGARVVARAWVDPAYKKRLLAAGGAAIAEFGLRRGTGRTHGGSGEHYQRCTTSLCVRCAHVIRGPC